MAARAGALALIPRDFLREVSNRPYTAILTAYESGSPLKERAMQQPKPRSAYEQSVDRLACAMREMLGMKAAPSREASKPQEPKTDEKPTE
jgi:hypothetical protein